ncbi:restriction endonuclease subunit S [Streptosporangium sandarakinum]|uniref:restriction endonuclease subunit S n=1 Tax=Streptosporangium sandarakinum TaxID=1260955 RepID=UPI003D93C8EE
MTDLPLGWEWAALGDIAETTLGKMLDRKKGTGRHPVPYLRNINVQWGRVDLDDVLTMDIPPDEQEFFKLRPGDLLVCEGGEIGRCAVWQGSISYMAFQKALHRVRPQGGISAIYLRYLLENLYFRESLLPYATGSTIKHIPQQQLRCLPIPIPPLNEQRRIVAALEDRILRIDRAKEDLARSLKRLEVLRKRVIVEAVPIPGPTEWDLVSVGDAGSVDLGRQRHPDWHTGSDMRPYLRVANVFEDRIDLRDVMQMNFPPVVFERFRLKEGDILLNEGQSPEYLGRPAMYRGDPEEVAFTNSLLRFRARPDVYPEWALLVFRRHMHAKRFVKEVRITTNLAHLSAGRLKSVEFPIPPMDEQKRIVGEVRESLSLVSRMDAAIRTAMKRSDYLRQALLREAFAGRLVPQDPADEPASELLARIRAERAAQAKPQRARRTKAARPPVADPTGSPAVPLAEPQTAGRTEWPDASRTPTTYEQGELL